MTRLGDLNPRATRLTFTMCPGTDIYMPPEAVRTQPVYSEKVDCFSFGVIIVQILSRQFPKPGDRLKAVRINDPPFYGGEVEVRVPEIERRHNHISQIDNSQPLMQIASDCLKDNDRQRPSAQQLLEGMTNLKGSSEYIESARPIQEILNEKDVQIQEAQEQIQTLSSDIGTKDQMTQFKEQIIGEKNRDIEAKTATIVTLEEDKLALQNQLQSQRQQHKQIIQQKSQVIAAMELIIRGKEEALEMFKIEKSQLQAQLESQEQIHSKEILKIISSKEEIIENKDKEIGELRRMIKSIEEQMHRELIKQQKACMEEISKKNMIISSRNAMIADKDKQVVELEQSTKHDEERLHRMVLNQQRLHVEEISKRTELSHPKMQ